METIDSSSSKLALAFLEQVESSYAFRLNPSFGLSHVEIDDRNGEIEYVRDIDFEDLSLPASRIDSIKIMGELVLPIHSYPVEVVIWPVPKGMFSIKVEFGSAPFVAMFGKEGRAGGECDDEIKREFLGFCIHVASFFGANCFRIYIDDGTYENIPCGDLVSSLKAPDLLVRSHRMSLVEGVNTSMASEKDLQVIWGGKANIYESTLGFTVFDKLLPFDSKES